MRGEHENDDVVKPICLLLDQSAEQLPRDVLLALQKGRLRAIERAESRQSRFWGIPRWVTAGGVASLAILVVAVSLWIAPAGFRSNAVPDDDLDVESIADQLDLYEDLEFFLWLSEKDNAR